MADELKGQYEELDVDLIEGGGGVFDVTVDGRQVYSKKDTGRFPEPGEVAKLIG